MTVTSFRSYLLLVFIVVVIHHADSWSFPPAPVRGGLQVGRRSSWWWQRRVDAPHSASALHAIREGAASAAATKSLSLSLSLSKPLGMILEEVIENQPHGVFVQEISDPNGSAYPYRNEILGTKVGQVNGMDVTSMTFDDVMSVLLNAPSPVTVEFVASEGSNTAVADEDASSSSTTGELPVGTPVTLTVKSSTNGDSVSIQAKVGDNLRQTLLNNNVEVYQGLKQKLGNCGGAGQCGFCAFDFIEASDQWLERSDYEDKKLKKFSKARLSCLNSIQGPATIRKTQQ